MVDTARKMGFPLMAGSSLPVTWRRPEIELPLGGESRRRWSPRAARSRSTAFTRSNRFSAWSSAGCKGGRAGRQGGDLSGRRRGVEGGRRRRVVVGLAGGGPEPQPVAATSATSATTAGTTRRRRAARRFRSGPVAFVIEYRDGLKATALILNGHLDDTTFAARVAGKKETGFDAVLPTAAAGAAFLQALARRSRSSSRPASRRTRSSARC